MKVDLKTVIVDLDGTEILVNKEGEKLTVAHVMMVALNTALEGDEKDGANQRMKKFKLLQNVFSNKEGEIEINSGDINMVKDRIRKIYPSPVIYGRVCEAFGDQE